MPEPGRLPAERVRRRTYVLLLAGAITFVAALLAAWIALPGVRESKSLWVLFLYCFPSEFVIATVPHEPALLYFSKYYDALTVAGVSAAGTVLTEWLNYRVVGHVTNWEVFRKALKGRTVTRLVGWFDLAPFAALWVAGFTPIPFYPFRILAVIARYPAWKYLVAVLLSRTPRFWVIAVAGAVVGFSNQMLIVLAVVLAAVGLAPATKAFWRRKGRT
jgi:membrane protein YqaA with SNARE-associated domain